jgi:hypothetical protein
MSLQSWQETLITSAVDGTQILNTTVQASIIPPAAKYTLPAGFFSVPGKEIRITAKGRVSCVVTTPGTLLFQVLFGATAVYNNAAAAMNLNVVAKTDVSWWFEYTGTCRAIGTSANLMGVATFQSEAVVGSGLPTVGGNGSLIVPASAMAVGSNFDSTVAQVVDLQAKFSVATATTALTCHAYKLESLN